MKTINNRISVLFLLLALGLGSCASTNRLTMTVKEPAPVFLDSHIQRVAIVNRSEPSEGHKTLDKLDRILSLEGLKLDTEGAKRTAIGLYDELKASDRFEQVVLVDSLEEGRVGLSIFPAAMSWSVVENLCETYGVDAIFSLEFYDTDTRADYNLTTVDVPIPFGDKASLPAHSLTLATDLVQGWRIYDPTQKLLLDEYATRDQIILRGQGINPVKAFEAIAGRKEAVMDKSSDFGTAYAFRLQPYQIRVARDYYVRGTDNFKIAQRRAQAGDWDGAAVLWEAELGNRKPKVAGRAAYNMAIINEINGDLDAAIQWASKSYADYNDRNALDYLNVLRYRQRRLQELNVQLAR